MQMPIKAIAPWFGGKRGMAASIVAELGRHSGYFEPFCGSMAVLFAKPASAQETASDLHGELTNLARVLADPELCPQLYARARRVLCCTELYYAAIAKDPEGKAAQSLEAALDYLVASWQGRNGVSGSVRTNFAPAVRFTPGGGSSATRWRNAVESIPAWHERLRNVAILKMDAFELIEKIADAAGAALYVDPPYVAASRAKRGAGSMYLHDFEPADHGRLRDALTRFKRARVVVSYYDCEQVRELYEGWTIRTCTRHKNLSVQNRRGKGRCEAPELLILNGPSYAAGGERLFS